MIPSFTVLFADYFQGAGLLLILGFMVATEGIPSYRLLSKKYVITYLALFSLVATTFVPMVFEPKEFDAIYAELSCFAYGIGFVTGIFLFLFRNRIWKSYIH